MESTSLNVIEHCRISPPLGSVPAISLPLTFFDLIYLPMPSAQLLYFYEFHHSKDYFLEAILPKLKHSLSLTLQHFFPCAGNLTWPPCSTKPEISYVPGDSIILTIAESNYDFYHLVGHHAKSVNPLSLLVPHLVKTSDTKRFPVMALQVTVFPNKGICIGATFNHSLCDGTSFNLFIKSWAQFCDSGMIDQQPCCDRSIVKDPNRLDLVYMNHFKTLNLTIDTFTISPNMALPSNEVLATFRISRSDIKRLKQWISSELENKNMQKLQLSAFVLSCAYVWICLMKAQWSEELVSPSEDPMQYFMFPVDCRARLDPPLPDEYFGNCLKGYTVEAKRSDLIRKGGMTVAAARIGTVVENIGNGDQVMKDMDKIFSYDFSSPEQVLFVAGSPNLGMYKTDFGWGNPKKTEFVSIAGTGAIFLSDCPTESGAVEVRLVRDKITMEAFTSFFYRGYSRFSAL